VSPSLGCIGWSKNHTQDGVSVRTTAIPPTHAIHDNGDARGGILKISAAARIAIGGAMKIEHNEKA
jgi:hypothetical protein